MLVACRLAGLSALETYYAGVREGAQCGARQPPWPHSGRREGCGGSRFRSRGRQSRRFPRPVDNERPRALRW